MLDNKINFEKEIDKLNDILDKISTKTLPLDESLKLYQEGKEIIKTLEEHLKIAEEEVNKVTEII